MILINANPVVSVAGSPMESLLTHMALVVNKVQQTFFLSLWSSRRVGLAQGLSPLMGSLLQVVGLAKPSFSPGLTSM